MERPEKRRSSYLPLLLLSAFFFTAACSPEVGSKEWCESIKEKSKENWTAKEAQDFTKHCLF